MVKQLIRYLSVLAVTAAIAWAQNQTSTRTDASAGEAAATHSKMVPAHTVAPVIADITIATVNPNGPGQSVTGQYYRATNGNIRQDSPAGSVITNFQSATITTLNPRTMQAVVASTPGPKGRYLPPNPPPSTPTVTPLGTTTVEGHPVTMTRITFDSSPGQVTEVWTATDLLFVVLLKQTMPDGSSVTKQYQNIQQTEPDPNLFTVPPGYTVVSKQASAGTVQ